MAKREYVRCRICRRHRDEVGRLSSRGKCAECGKARREENALSISAKQGAPYLHQQRRQFMKAYSALLDAERASA
jgi:hypothetical protein